MKKVQKSFSEIFIVYYHLFHVVDKSPGQKIGQILKLL